MGKIKKGLFNMLCSRQDKALKFPLVQWQKTPNILFIKSMILLVIVNCSFNMIGDNKGINL